MSDGATEMLLEERREQAVSPGRVPQQLTRVTFGEIKIFLPPKLDIADCIYAAYYLLDRVTRKL